MGVYRKIPWLKPFRLPSGNSFHIRRSDICLINMIKGHFDLSDARMRSSILSVRNWRAPLHRRRADAAYPLTRRQNFSPWNDVIAAIFIMTLYQKSDSVNRCIIYLKKNPAKCHPDPISNDGTLGFFDEQNKKMTISWSKKTVTYTHANGDRLYKFIIQHAKYAMCCRSNYISFFTLKIWLRHFVTNAILKFLKQSLNEVMFTWSADKKINAY